MGRKRVTELAPGGKTTLYIPQDIDPNVLEFLKQQKNLSKTLIELAYNHVYNPVPLLAGRLGAMISIPEVKNNIVDSTGANQKSRRAAAMEGLLNTDKLG